MVQETLSRITPFSRPSDVEAASMLRVAMSLLSDPASNPNDVTAARYSLRRLYLDGFTGNPAVLKMAGVSGDVVQRELARLNKLDGLEYLFCLSCQNWKIDTFWERSGELCCSACNLRFDTEGD